MHGLLVKKPSIHSIVLTPNKNNNNNNNNNVNNNNNNNNDHKTLSKVASKPIITPRVMENKPIINNNNHINNINNPLSD
jgi:hypothetical protein